MIVMIDNYDSFTFNVVQLFETVSGQTLDVVRNDAFDPQALLDAKPRAILISPGPGEPSKAGRIVDLVRANDDIPLLGICLGHQAIGAAFGATIERAPAPVHGKISAIRHNGEGLFASAPERFNVTRYHSLAINRASLPSELVVDAETDDGTVMAVRHRTRNLFGLQFHPESYGSECGELLVEAFLRLAGLRSQETSTTTDREATR
ncbi:MAG: aminodeoxychorismate/anthranilate synthase component II [Thermoanaerobaculia bacterium]